jgi:hypothetical protein
MPATGLNTRVSAHRRSVYRRILTAVARKLTTDGSIGTSAAV